jgi:hypothetical protein
MRGIKEMRGGIIFEVRVSYIDTDFPIMAYS